MQPAPNGEDAVPPPDRENFHISTTPRDEHGDPRVSTAPHGEETPKATLRDRWLAGVRGASVMRGGYDPIPRSETLLYLYNCNIPWSKTVGFRRKLASVRRFNFE